MLSLYLWIHGSSQGLLRETTPCLIPLLLVQQAQGEGFGRLGQDLPATLDEAEEISF